MKKTASRPPRPNGQPKADAQAALAWLQRNSSAKVRDGMARYGLPADKALGVPINRIQALAKQLGRNHDLAVALWETDIYEARLLVAYVGEAARLTPAQMDRWCREFDNWGVVDTICFALFNDSPHAWGRVDAWGKRKDEFVKRAGFALLACLSGPKRKTADEAFLRRLPLITRGAEDERNFLKKGVSWALRMIGRRNVVLNAAAVDLARRLAGADSPAARWIGRGALKELTSPAVVRRLADQAG